MSEDARASKLKRHAGWLLSRQAMTERQLEGKLAAHLRKSGFGLEDDTEKARAMIDDVIVICRGNGLLNDQAFAKRAVSHFEGQGRSKRRIRMILESKGVAPSVLETALDRDGDAAAALIFARKRRIGPFGPQEPAKKKSEMAKMQRQGFDIAVINRVFRMSSEEAEEELNSGGSL